MDHNPFVIGGIGKGGNIEGGTKISHIITYNTPFRVNGQQVLVSIGLGYIATKNLFSYLFLKSLKATIMLKSSTLVSRLLRTDFKIIIKPPLLVTESPTATTGVPVVLMEISPNTVSRLAAISGNLNDSHQELAEDNGIYWVKNDYSASGVTQEQ